MLWLFLSWLEHEVTPNNSPKLVSLFHLTMNTFDDVMLDRALLSLLDGAEVD